MTKNQLIKGLEVLKNEQIIQYDIRESNPLVKLNEARMERLPFSNIELMKYREVLLKKLDYMLGYARTESCRGAYLSHYFGEKNVPSHCGHCDLCEKREKGVQNVLESKEVQSVIKLLEMKPVEFGYIRSETGLNARKLKQILNLLLRENKIMTKTGEPDVFYLLRETEYLLLPVFWVSYVTRFWNCPFSNYLPKSCFVLHSDHPEPFSINHAVFLFSCNNLCSEGID